MADPLDALRLPIVPLEPAPGFVDGLLQRIRSELRPLLIDPYLTEENPMTDVVVNQLTELVALLEDARVVEVVDWPGPEVPAALVRAGLTVVAQRHPVPPPNEPQFVLHEVRPGEPAPDSHDFRLDGGAMLSFRTIDARPPVVDLVSTFRPAEEQPAIVELAVTLGARAVWVEPGESLSPQARAMAQAAGLTWVEGVSIRTIAARVGRRGTTTSSVTAGLTYLDAPAAIDWLVNTLGFRLLERHDLPDGHVAHARLGWGTGMVFVSTRNPTGPWAATGPASLSLNQPDPAAVDALYERARSAGSDIVDDLHDAPYGSHQFSIRDPEGNLWTLGTYLPELPLH